MVRSDYRHDLCCTATSSLFVGRQMELALLRASLAAAQTGQGQFIGIVGDAGIGKSTLALMFGQEAATQGWQVALGRCEELAPAPPYSLWTDLLDQLPAQTDAPEWPMEIVPTSAAARGTSQLALFTQVRAGLAAHASQAPLLLILDDLQWADRASLELLRFLCRRVAALPLLIVGAYRADEPADSQPWQAFLPALLRETAVRQLALPPLTDDEARMLLHQRYNLPASTEDRLVAWVQARAEGNPFFLEEVCSQLEETGVVCQQGGQWTVGTLGTGEPPALIQQVIGQRLARLAEEDHRLLALAAVLGREVPLALWQALGQISEEQLFATIARASAAHLLTAKPSGSGVRFTHELIRATLYASAISPQRRQWHRLAGEALSNQPAPDAEVVAYHFAQAGDARALAWLTAACTHAQRAYAWLQAAAHLEAALDLSSTMDAATIDRGWLLLRLALLRRYDDSPRASKHLADAVQLAARTADRALQGYVRYYRGLLQCFTGLYAPGLANLETGLKLLACLTSSERTAAARRLPGEVTDPDHLRGALAVYQAFTGRHAEALALSNQVAAATTDRCADAAYAQGLVEAVRGQPVAARAAYQRARTQYRAAANPYLAAVAATEELCWVARPYFPERLAERATLAAEAEEALARATSVREDTAPRAARFPLLALEGRWAEAWRLARALRARPSDAESFVVPAYLAPLAYERGNHKLAWTLVREILPAGPATMPGDAIFLTALAMQRLAAQLALDAGDHATARDWLAMQDRWLAWGEPVLGQAEGQLAWAGYYRATGRPALAHHHAREALTRASRPRQPLAQLAAHLLLGELCLDQQQPAAAAPHLAQARALAAACAAPFAQARVALAGADYYLQERQPDAARDALTAARAVAKRLGAKPMLERITPLEARLANTVTAPTYPAGLTAREIAVLRLVAQGATNREVAAALGISPKTAMHHVTHILTKTNSPNRAAAVAFAHEHHLLDS